jgi:hypothetical protein
MKVFLLAIPVALVFSTASAQQSTCTRDVTRFCRAHMNDGDMVVLQCLQQNRGRLSAACRKTLADNGQ